MWPNPEFPSDLVTVTEKFLNGKLNFLCSVCIAGALKRKRVFKRDSKTITSSLTLKLLITRAFSWNQKL